MLPLQGTWPQDPGQMADHIMNKSWWREGGDWKDVPRRKEDTVNTIIGIRETLIMGWGAGNVNSLQMRPGEHQNL